MNAAICRCGHVMFDASRFWFSVGTSCPIGAGRRFYSGGLHAQTSSGNVQSSSGAAVNLKRSKWSATQLSELFRAD